MNVIGSSTTVGLQILFLRAYAPHE